MRKQKNSPLGFYTIGIAALFLAGFLLLVVFGAQSYRRTVAGQSDNMQSRALLSYLATTIKAGDERGRVSLREDGEVGQVLVVEDGSSGYAMRIYRLDGRMLEDYAAATAPLNAQNAQTIGETERFRVELQGDLVRVETDAGSVLLHLRSGEAA